MKTIIRVIFSICCAVAFCVPVSAGSFTDDMNNSNSDNIKQYSGLTPVSFPGGSAALLPDATVLSFAGGTRASAYAQYRLEGATGVTVSIYSHAGTFVGPNPDKPGKYMLGVSEHRDFRWSQSLPQALYCPATDAVYTYEGGLKQMYTDMNAYLFGDVITPPQGELIGYAVNIYFSNDGQRFTRAQARQTMLRFEATVYCYEQYIAAVPSAAKYVRVEINDVGSVPVEGGGSYPKQQGSVTSLASVIITGDNLVMGEPEVATQAPAPQESSSAGGHHNGEGTYAKAESSKTEKETEENDAESGTSSKSASSKFEGTITSSSKAGRSASSKAAPKSAESPKSSASTESSEESIPQNETVTYEISRGTGKSIFNNSIIGYIIIVSGFVLALIIFQFKK